MSAPPINRWGLGSPRSFELLSHHIHIYKAHTLGLLGRCVGYYLKAAPTNSRGGRGCLSSRSTHPLVQAGGTWVGHSHAP